MNNEIIKTVCETLKIDESFAKNNYKEIKGLNAYYFWTQGRGGAQMIIGTDGSKLVCGSALSFEKLLAEYIAGRRN